MQHWNTKAVSRTLCWALAQKKRVFNLFTDDCPCILVAVTTQRPHFSLGSEHGMLLLHPTVLVCWYAGGKWGRPVVSHLCSAKVAVWLTSAVFSAGILLGTKSGRKSWGKTDLVVYCENMALWKDPGTLTGLHISPVFRKDCSWTNTFFLKACYSMLWAEVMVAGSLNSAGVLLPAGKFWLCWILKAPEEAGVRKPLGVNSQDILKTKPHLRVLL